MERHPELGEKILAPIEQLRDVRSIVRSCHERWDGTGYPDGLVRRGDPARGAHHLRVRRVPRHVDRPSVPPGAARRRGAPPAGRGGRDAVRPARGRGLPAGVRRSRARSGAAAQPAASAARRPRNAQTEKSATRSSARPKASSDVHGVTGDEAAARLEQVRDRVERRHGLDPAVQQVERHVDGREEEEQEDGHLHQVGRPASCESASRCRPTRRSRPC